MYNSIVKEALSNTSLRRIRLKIDPKTSHPDISNLNGYEGYILEENDNDTVDVFITSDNISDMQDTLIPSDSVYNVPSSCIDIMGSLTVLEKFKLSLITYFKTTHSMPTDLLEDLVMAKTIKECRKCLDVLTPDGYEVVLTSFIDLLEEK